MEANVEKISPFYNDAVQQIKSAILESQLETARAANKQMLSLYYAVGKFVSENSREGTWGKGAIDTISAQLRREMPGLRGFSATNIKYMRIFYERWLPVLNRQPTADELENAEKSEKLEHDMWVDLLFYNRELQSLVVVELKKGEFKPAYLGQLSAYMRVLNDDERKANENPVIGIILCKGADKSFVEYLLQDYNQPMGVTTYKVMPEKLKAVMPDEKLLLEVM